MDHVVFDQNGGILGEDAYEFAKKYNTNVRFVQDDTMKTNTDDVLLYVLNGSHMIYIHKDEIYNPASFQKTTNGCTLWAAIFAALRPCVDDYNEMMKLIDKITQDKLVIIFKHFFGRDKSWFRYVKN